MTMMPLAMATKGENSERRSALFSQRPRPSVLLSRTTTPHPLEPLLPQAAVNATEDITTNGNDEIPTESTTPELSKIHHKLMSPLYPRIRPGKPASSTKPAEIATTTEQVLIVEPQTDEEFVSFVASDVSTRDAFKASSEELETPNDTIITAQDGNIVFIKLENDFPLKKQILAPVRVPNGRAIYLASDAPSGNVVPINIEPAIRQEKNTLISMMPKEKTLKDTWGAMDKDNSKESTMELESVESGIEILSPSNKFSGGSAVNGLLGKDLDNQIFFHTIYSDKQLVPAESRSRSKIEIKEVNGQLYEYEYIYYYDDESPLEYDDVIDVEPVAHELAQLDQIKNKGNIEDPTANEVSNANLQDKGGRSLQEEMDISPESGRKVSHQPQDTANTIETAIDDVTVEEDKLPLQTRFPPRTTTPITTEDREIEEMFLETDKEGLNEQHIIPLIPNVTGAHKHPNIEVKPEHLEAEWEATPTLEHVTDETTTGSATTSGNFEIEATAASTTPVQLEADIAITSTEAAAEIEMDSSLTTENHDTEVFQDVFDEEPDITVSTQATTTSTQTTTTQVNDSKRRHLRPGTLESHRTRSSLGGLNRSLSRGTSTTTAPITQGKLEVETKKESSRINSRNKFSSNLRNGSLKRSRIRGQSNESENKVAIPPSEPGIVADSVIQKGTTLGESDRDGSEESEEVNDKRRSRGRLGQNRPRLNPLTSQPKSITETTVQKPTLAGLQKDSPRTNLFKNRQLSRGRSTTTTTTEPTTDSSLSDVLLDNVNETGAELEELNTDVPINSISNSTTESSSGTMEPRAPSGKHRFGLRGSPKFNIPQEDEAETSQDQTHEIVTSETVPNTEVTPRPAAPAKIRGQNRPSLSARLSTRLNQGVKQSTEEPAQPHQNETPDTEVSDKQINQTEPETSVEIVQTSPLLQELVQEPIEQDNVPVIQGTRRPLTGRTSTTTTEEPSDSPQEGNGVRNILTRFRDRPSLAQKAGLQTRKSPDESEAVEKRPSLSSLFKNRRPAEGSNSSDLGDVKELVVNEVAPVQSETNAEIEVVKEPANEVKEIEMEPIKPVGEVENEDLHDMETQGSEINEVFVSSELSVGPPEAVKSSDFHVKENTVAVPTQVKTADASSRSQLFGQRRSARVLVKTKPDVAPAGSAATVDPRPVAPISRSSLFSRRRPLQEEQKSTSI